MERSGEGNVERRERIEGDRPDLEPRHPGAPPPAERSPAAAVPRSLIAWGSVIAGLLVAITTMVVLSVLGLAIGLSAFQPDDLGATTADTAATIWGIASFVIAFGLGGFVAARMAPSLDLQGAFSGLMVGVTAITAVIFFTALGIGNVLGAAAANLGDIANVATDFEVETDQVAEVTRQAYEDAEGGAWGTLIGLVVALAASSLGGLLGSRPTPPVDDRR